MDGLHIYLDSAELGVLRAVLPHPVVYGVTTNPTLMKRAGLSYAELPEFVTEVVALGVRALHLQVPGGDADEVVGAGRKLAALAEPGRILVKIPATVAGLKAAAALVAEGIPVTTTAVYRTEQALGSQLLGARYAAPYLGRLQDSGQDGLAVIGQMQRTLERYAPKTSAPKTSAPETYAPSAGTHTRLLVASVRSRTAVLELLALGVGAITLPPPLFTELFTCPETDRAAAAFASDAKALQALKASQDPKDTL